MAGNIFRMLQQKGHAVLSAVWWLWLSDYCIPKMMMVTIISTSAKERHFLSSFGTLIKTPGKIYVFHTKRFVASQQVKIERFKAGTFLFVWDNIMSYDSVEQYSWCAINISFDVTLTVSELQMFVMIEFLFIGSWQNTSTHIATKLQPRTA